ncbi:hypothetical protein F8S13_03960 [Chloroflexia bacterium SDU3-3]|nr:hypothetical protein F8S13_03960 [Chloroflexia bacterium SDU3-3]
MCGGIRFAYDPALKPALDEAFTEQQVGSFEQSGLVETVFWQARPMLPAVVDGALRLFDWGNRDPQLKLPKTGWVRMESLQEGKWNYLRPKEVIIPACQGVEKKVWFDIDIGIQGYLVRRGDTERIYMLTLPPTPEYTALTGHDRMPALINQDQVTPRS